MGALLARLYSKNGTRLANEKTMKLTGLFLIAFIVVSCASTKKADSSEITEIRWGSSFGMCRGYCYSEYQYEKDGIRYIRKGWDTVAYPKTLEVFAMTPTLWPEMKATVNLDSFEVLPERIGCPDCADGGSEWIEIIQGSKSKKVTFEYGQSPAGMGRLLAFLRKE